MATASRRQRPDPGRRSRRDRRCFRDSAPPSTLLTNNQEDDRTCLLALILSVVLLLLIGYYARRYRQLVEYDIDSFIWDRCDGYCTVAAIAEKLTGSFDVDCETARQAVQATLRRLDELGLLDPARE